MSTEKIIDKMRRSPNNIDFHQLETICREKFGEPRQQGTSHQIYKIPGGVGRINIQNDHGKAKSYQVRQVLKALEQLEKQQNG